MENSASANPIGHKTGPIVSSVPPVSAETKAAVQAAAQQAAATPHLQSSDAREKRVEGLANSAGGDGGVGGVGKGMSDVGDTKG